MERSTGTMGAAEAAARLGVRREEIYRLIRSGVLPHDRVAGRIVISEGALRRLEATPRPVGRRFAATAAWTMLWMLSHRGLPNEVAALGHVSASRRSQLRRHLLAGDAMELASRLRGRARRESLYCHPAARERLLRAPEATPAGYSALEQVEADLIAGHDAPAEAYVGVQGFERLTKNLGLLRDAPERNVVLHVVDDLEMVPQSMGAASPPVVALDLIESGDARAGAAGRQLWRDWLQRYRTDDAG